MLYVDIPSPRQIGALDLVRSDACVSIYLATTPLTQQIGQSRTRLTQLVKDAVQQLEAANVDKRRIAALEDHFETVQDDDDFWEDQAHSLAILATPDKILTFRLPNELSEVVTVADRFHLKPLLRAVTFPNTAHVLAVSENDVRLIEVSGDLPAREIRVADMPRDAASAVGKATINDSGAGRRIGGKEGQKIRLAQYIRKIDAALRPVLAGSELPVILASTLPVASLVRSVSSVEMLDKGIEASPDDMSPADLATAARPVLDAHYDDQIAALHDLFEARAGDNRTTTDISDAARASTFGGIDTLLVDIDNVVTGTIDETSGAVTFLPDGGAGSYGIVDEIAGRALRTGARVLAVRRQDIPRQQDLAAILRYPM
ncbi:hypothetical protein [Oceaniglobus indicus]|uniref:baeRF11 domain-containing protein n=1 Tax=Oceaniglobus indicus TaxID=2047749 RepID=UPI000C19A1C7|nr:hypothetical protein [Oceaniglobus indicus]